ncbi:glycoside hydrolase family 38 C-terminal domain-containing protein [Cellulomonas sp. PhB143]|uniref:alpha-mannosidase n=1 Tax=Cellulomonas sp. PhB143 TaxID=2485186 RepID=UPI000F49DDDC|nr:glycoside hydrolase family 38 C-terminal domain-containing protein [Cellulomonas sp. PhB143]
MLTHHQSVQLRVDRFVRERLEPALVRAAAPVRLEAWEAPGEPVPFADAVAQPFADVGPGHRWGRAWGTLWLRLTGTVPAEWDAEAADVELVVDPGFVGDSVGFQVEALAYTADGRTLKGIEPKNHHVRLGLAPGEAFEVYVEAAANPNIIEGNTFAPTVLGRRETAPDEPTYALGRVAVVHRDVEVWELVQDVATVHGLAHELPEASPRRAELFAALDATVDAVDPHDVHATAARGRAALADVLSSPAARSAHRVYAVGHAHIDSAWLWPVRETVRKCARTFSNVLDLMDADPDLVFACSSAQQIAWIQERYPELFERIRARVDEGRFVPVGGMWVESDTNLPGSEAMARQFVEGTRYFLEELGVQTTEVWLPDSFGYSAALPQIARAAGAGYFLTQKLSWNEVNQFPHHTFDWEGIDGTRIFAHLPPVDTYNSMLSPSELAHTERNFADKGRANTSLVPFGFGDGGGGPTREMMAAARRAASLEGSPTVRVSRPDDFFRAASEELELRPVWAGELYLESHRGTYTSQARVKRGNRRSEALLHEAELWSATASVRTGAAYPAERLRSAWRTVLLNQFHDILPGSSIGWVYDQAEEEYRRVERELEAVIAEALAALAGPPAGTGDERAATVANSSPFAVDGVPAFGVGVPRAGDGGVRLEVRGDDLVLENGALRVVLDENGLVRSLVDLATGRESVPEGTRGGLPQIFTDTPRRFDAWDVDVEYRRLGQDLDVADAVEVVERGGRRAAVRTTRKVGSSVVTQTISLEAGRRVLDMETSVDWHEQQKMLKLAFPVDVHTSSARSEIQFGHVERPTHTNTSWDEARFETVAHRWVHVADAGNPGSGLGVANDATYGHDVTRHARRGGGTYSVVRQTLLKAPLFPDPTADQGEHLFRTALVPGGVAASVEAGYRLNLPPRPAGAEGVAPLVAVDGTAVVETVKLAEDGSGDVVVRLYESLGERADVVLRASFAAREAAETDLLERATDASAVRGVERAPDGATVRLALRPFQLVTLRLSRGEA